MEIIKRYLDNGQYLSQAFSKKAIILHHTVGLSIDSAWRWWNSTPQRVGTPYIIGRDGTIVECFDPEVWAYHIGNREDDNWFEKHGIGIELVGAGRLKKVNKEYRFYPLWPNKLRYTIIPSSEVETLKKPFRGQNYFHKYSEEQIKSLIWLLGDLKKRFPTLDLSNDLTDFYEYDEKVLRDHIPGIWSHSTLRKDKDDIYPDKDLIKALESMQKDLSNEPKEGFTPKLEKSEKKKAKSSKSGKSNKS